MINIDKYLERVDDSKLPGYREYRGLFSGRLYYFRDEGWNKIDFYGNPASNWECWIEENYPGKLIYQSPEGKGSYFAALRMAAAVESESDAESVSAAVLAHRAEPTEESRAKLLDAGKKHVQEATRAEIAEAELGAQYVQRYLDAGQSLAESLISAADDLDTEEAGK